MPDDLLTRLNGEASLQTRQHVVEELRRERRRLRRSLGFHGGKARLELGPLRLDPVELGTERRFGGDPADDQADGGALLLVECFERPAQGDRFGRRDR